jgi:hypothetical protein
MNKKILTIFLVMILLVLVCGCVEEKKDDEIEKGEGTLRLQITDKPGDLDIVYANVSISMIQVHKSGADEDEDEDEDNDEEDDNGDDGFVADANGEYEGDVGEDIQFVGKASGGTEPYNWSWDFGDGNISWDQNPLHNYSEKGVYIVNLTVTDDISAKAWDETIAKIEQEDDNSEAGWITVIDYSQTFDLIALQNVTELLGEKNLSEGKYTQIRLTVEKAIITINNSGELEEHDLKIPSSKIKLIKPFWIYENETTVLTLDFDVYESVHETGKNKFIMKPTIKLIQE